MVVATADYYRLLEVSPNASPAVIKAAFHALMAQYHPDRNPGSTRIAQDINEAYKVLSDPVKRQEYDRALNSGPAAGTILGAYRILGKIAEGRVGTTYKAEHILTGGFVCLKHANKVSPQYEHIMLKEAKAMWDLRHYGIPEIRDLIKLDDGSVALIMSYVPGLNLAEIVDRIRQKRQLMDPEDVAWITARTLNALMYLHYHGIIHGDVKPQNIVVDDKQHYAVLVDYGLAMVKPQSTDKALGYTPHFAAPEQITGKPLLPASDFYSLGKTILYALCGGDLQRVDNNQIPSRLQKPFDQFLARMLNESVDDRPRWPDRSNVPNLCDEFEKVRRDSFGRDHTGIRPIVGLN